MTHDDSHSPPPPANPRRVLSTRDFAAGVRGGDRSVLARAITLVESSRPEHRAEFVAAGSEL